MSEVTKAEHRFFCPLPVLNMRGAKRKSETELQWRRRFDRLMERHSRLLDMRVRIALAASRFSQKKTGDGEG